jgi:hypothetical protein
MAMTFFHTREIQKGKGFSVLFNTVRLCYVDLHADDVGLGPCGGGFSID